MEEVQLPIRGTKLDGYENVEVPTGSRRRRLAYFMGAVGLVLTIAAVGIYGANSRQVTGNSPSEATTTSTSAITETTAQTCGLSGSSFRTLNIDGITRSYKVVMPTTSEFPASLIVAYHGILSDVTKIEGKMKLQQSSAAATSILVYPEAKNKGGGLLDPAAFNGAGCCKDSTSFKDEEFFAAIVTELTQMGCVDAKKNLRAGLQQRRVYDQPIGLRDCDPRFRDCSLCSLGIEW